MSHQKLSTTFLTLSQRIKAHLLLMYCIKNLPNLFWIFVYVTSGPFAGLLSVDFTHVKKVHLRFLATCILNFYPKTSIKL